MDSAHFRRRPFQGLITLLVVWALVAGGFEAGTYFGNEFGTPPIPTWVVVSQYIIAAMAGCLALVLTWRIPDRGDAVALSLHLALLSVAHALLVDGSGVPTSLHRASFSAVGAASLASFVGFTRVFPQPAGPVALIPIRLALFHDRTAVLSWLFAVPYSALLYFTYATYGGEYGMMLVERYVPGARAAVACIAIGFLALVGVGISGLGQTFRAAAESDRRRILIVVAGYTWSLFALLTMASLIGLSLVTGSPVLVSLATLSSYVLWPAAVLPVLSTLFAAVFFTTAFDPTLAIRRTAIYGGLFVLLTFVFAGLEELITGQITQRLGLPDVAATWIAGGAVALAIGPLHGRLERFVGRRVGVID